MIQSKLFVCSDSAIVDARTNTVSVFMVTEQLNAPAFPVAIPRLCVVGIFTREQADPAVVDLQLRLDSGDQQLYIGPMNVNFFQQVNARAIIEMRGLALPAPGSLNVTVSYQGRIIGSWSILLNQIGQPELQMFLAPNQPA